MYEFHQFTKKQFNTIVNVLLLLLFFFFYVGMLTSFHYVYLLTGMLLSQVATKFFIYSYVNMITLIMSTLNMLMLLVISDPPYYRLKLEKQTNMLDYILKIQDFKRSSICKRVYTVYVYN